MQFHVPIQFDNDQKTDDVDAHFTELQSNHNSLITSINDSFIYKSGYITGSNVIQIKQMTITDAKQYALSLNNCIGFTFKGTNHPNNKTVIWFKFSRNGR